MSDAFLTKLALGSFAETDEVSRERVYRELHDLVGSFAHDPEIRRWARSVEKKEGQHALAKATGKNLHPATEYVLQGLMAVDRLGDIEDWWKEYVRLLKRAHAGKEATITTAHPLTDKLRTALKKSLEKRFNMPVVLTEKLNPAIKGGIKNKTDDWLYDATLKGRLTRLTEELIA